MSIFTPQDRKKLFLRAVQLFTVTVAAHKLVDDEFEAAKSDSGTIDATKKLNLRLIPMMFISLYENLAILALKLVGLFLTQIDRILTFVNKNNLSWVSWKTLSRNMNYLDVKN